MTTVKRFYTYAELTHRSTAQLIPIYNRLFNTNIWDEVFNPYEARQEILMALFAEMRAQEVVAQFTDADRGTGERYKALEIRVSEEGFAIIWTANKRAPNNRKFDDQTISTVRSLRAEGESVEFISAVFGMPRNRVYRICRGDVYGQ